MIHLYKRISSNCNPKYRTRSGSVQAYKEGSYHVVELEQGSPLVRQLKAIHGFVERKETQTYNAIKDVKKESQKVKRSIVNSAKKVEKIVNVDSKSKVEKTVKSEKKKTTKKKPKTGLTQDNTKL